MTEILNLDYHRCRLIVRALQTSPKQTVAAELLGISERTLYKYMDLYGIKRGKGRIYYATKGPRPCREHLAREINRNLNFYHTQNMTA